MKNLNNCDSLKDYIEYLECLKKNFKSILVDHKKAYFDWKLSPIANDTDFKKTKKQMDINVNNKISKLIIKLNELFISNQKKLDNKTKDLNEIKKKLKIIENLYKNENDIDKASGPLENNLSKELLHDYLYSSFLFFGILFSSTFLFKNFYK